MIRATTSLRTEVRCSQPFSSPLPVVQKTSSAELLFPSRLWLGSFSATDEREVLTAPRSVVDCSHQHERSPEPDRAANGSRPMTLFDTRATRDERMRVRCAECLQSKHQRNLAVASGSSMYPNGMTSLRPRPCTTQCLRGVTGKIQPISFVRAVLMAGAHLLSLRVCPSHSFL